ncbi:protein TolR [Litorivicinus sp.]|jgi:biopolymer transport protein TolR|nr:protein TolR [Litorivicinus sp.]MDB9862826.1 protein TolR [Litorivicinus sp.]MDC1208186.1 protein TolR [Litorivicinus sp.]MDC1240370.1 protein TolR [Litorivicinus sp.]|tara:strand:- start:398 stop:826 length:429 start_codon:yes stop_codon:yes gene_type:complete
MARRSRRQRGRLVAEINVVPYIDVMLVLLVIFMVTAPMLTPGVPIDLPQASTEPLPVDSDSEPLVVSMNNEGELFMNLGGDVETPVTLGTIKDRVMKVLAAKPRTPVQLRGDMTLNYGAVMEVMSALQEVGVTSIGLVAETP